jgi:hypothetical protein
MTAFFYGAILGNGMTTAVVVSAFWLFVFLSTVLSIWPVVLGWIAYALTRTAGVVVVRRWSLVERGLSGRSRTLMAASMNGYGLLVGFLALHVMAGI